ncbi:MAG: metal ABC transporter permease, partial [Candidatus Omnitrophica bacterium]|nr:metal ABC transporter permease [Candidatus Omnitrophota bacterium]
MELNAITEFFGNYTVQIVILGTLVLGLTSGALGSFALLRKQSLLGDAISHATLPGVCLAFLITRSKSPLVLLIGAGIAGWTGALLINWITENSRLKQDSALGIVLSVFFGLGLVILTIVQKLPTATKAGLDKFLFGNASTLLISDVRVMAVLSLLIVGVLIAFWKEFKLIVFDIAYARSLGLNIRFLSTLLSTLIVTAIVIGLQTVGVILMSAMLVAPAASARQWTDRLGVMVVLSALIGAVCGVG